MATYTEHYNLIKPALNDKVNINNLNDNADIIDTALNNKVDTDDTQNITTSAANCLMPDGVTSVEDALDGLNTALTNETVLLNQMLTTTSTKYDLSEHVGDYMFIAFILGWYYNDSNDNIVVMPSSAFGSSDYLLIPRKNDLSTQSYAKINIRGYEDGVNFIFAEGTEGVSIKVVGIIHK